MTAKKVSEDDYDTEWGDDEEGTGGAGVTQITGLTILASGWVADGSLYKYELSNAAITADHICEIVPDDAAYDILVAAKPLAKISSSFSSIKMQKRIGLPNLPISLIFTMKSYVLPTRPSRHAS